MHTTNLTFFNDLRDEIANQNVIFVIGAGLSIFATEKAPAASWKGLLHDGLNRVENFDPTVQPDTLNRIKEQIDSTDIEEMLLAATFIAQKLGGPGNGEYGSWLRDTVGSLVLKHPEVISAIAKTGCLLMTTNYDTLIEEVIGEQSITWKQCPQFELVLHGKQKGVIHLHGVWNDPASVILGKDSYSLIENDERFQALLRAAHLNKTFVYVGCGEGLADPNFTKFFDWCAKFFPDSQVRRYRLAKDDQIASLQAQHPKDQRVQVIPYGPDYSDLLKFFEKLQPNIARQLPNKASAELNKRVDELIRELGRNPLVGRQDELGKIERFLELSKGFLLISGDAGYGKSALISHFLMGHSRGQKIIRHFFSYRSDITRPVLEFYRSVLASLCDYWNQPLRPPASEEEARDLLFNIFEQARLSGTGRKSPVVIIMDGLDEATSSIRWSPFFPKELPEGVYIVASVRLGRNEAIPDHINQWIIQCDEQIELRLLGRGELTRWVSQMGGRLAELAAKDDFIGQLLSKTGGLPLHVACILDDLLKLSAGPVDYAAFMAKTPTGFAPYVDSQFRRLVDSPVGKERRWREFFGLLAEAKAELQLADINAILGLTIWDLYQMPQELHRWVAQRDDDYTFRNQALRQVFAELNPWPEAKVKLLKYSLDWKENNRPYAIRAVLGHLKDAGERQQWLETASDANYLHAQAVAFPDEPLMPFQTIEEAIREAIVSGDVVSLSELILIHADWMAKVGKINPLKSAKTNPRLAWQQIKLVEMIDSSTEPVWQTLVAWRCIVDSRIAEGVRLLGEIEVSSQRGIHIIYWANIVESLLVSIHKHAPERVVKIGLSLLDTGSLPRFLVETIPPGKAIDYVHKWYDQSINRLASGWVGLWKKLAEKGDLEAVFEGTRDILPEHKANDFFEIALVLFQLGRVDDLKRCLSEIRGVAPASRDGEIDFMAKPIAVLLAAIGSLQLQKRDMSGRALLQEAEAVACSLPPTVPFQQVETIVCVACMCACAGEADAAKALFKKAIEISRLETVSRGIRLRLLVLIARAFTSVIERCPALRPQFVETLEAMEHLADRNLPLELESDFPRCIAVAWDALDSQKRAWQWIRRIPNKQFRGKAVAQFVERRLGWPDKNQALADVRRMLQQSRYIAHAGWSLMLVGRFHLQRQEWDEAAVAFSQAVMSGATKGGKIESAQLPLLLAEIGYAFDQIKDFHKARIYIEAAISQARSIRPPQRYWWLLNVVERTFWAQSTTRGVATLEETAAYCLEHRDGHLQIPLLCLLARVFCQTARRPNDARKVLAQALEIIRADTLDPLRGMVARCEVVEAFHNCGFHEEVEQRLGSLSTFALSRRIRPPEKADEVIAEAALIHARTEKIGGAETLLSALENKDLESAIRARAIVNTLQDRDADAENEMRKIRNKNLDARIRRDIACILIRKGRIDSAFEVIRRVQVDRDNVFPRIAMALVESGHAAPFYRLIVQATRYPNACSIVLGCLVRLRPELAPHLAKTLPKFVSCPTTD